VFVILFSDYLRLVVFSFTSAIAPVTLLNAGVDISDIAVDIVRHMVIHLYFASAIALFALGHHKSPCGRACGRSEQVGKWQLSSV
jgi:hypothetical protein